MKEKIYGLIEKLIERDANGNETMFNFIVILGIISSIIGTVSCFFENAGVASIIITLIGTVLLVTILWLGHKTRNYDFWSFIIIMMLNMLVLPTVFFASGGYHGGMPIWMVFMLVCIFYLLKGRYLVIATISTIIMFNGCYVLAHRFPWLVNEFATDDQVFFDIMLACMVISTMLCTFMRIQNTINDIERETNRRQKKELEEALKSKSLFLANMSHEIRTPINTIIGLNEMTLREEVSTEVEENSINIERASKMLLSLINDVLDLSKSESGKMDIVEAEYKLGDLFSEIVDTNWNRAQKKDLEFKISVSPDMPTSLFGDEGKIKQIMTNLLSNAIKYTMEGSVELSAHCDCVDDNHILLKIDVVDTGMGIRNEDMERLFDDFKRVNEQATRGIEGTGLGLSICKQLCELMGGSIAVDSIYRKGSTFSVTIPQRVMDNSPVGQIKIGSYSDVNRIKYKKTFEAPEAHVLVVDDNEMNLLVAKKLLRDTKVQLDLATSGEECLRYTASKEYDVIFMDHLMPMMDGIDTLEKVREQINGFCRRTPVIALTANVTMGSKERYKKFGFNDFLPKPMSGEMIESMLLQILPPDKIEYQNVGENSEAQSVMDIKLVNQARKRKVVIATDNSSDLPEHIIRQLDIRIINHYVVTDYGKFKDKREIYTDCLIEGFKKGMSMYSTAPSVEDFEEFFGDLLQTAEHVIYLPISSKVYHGCANAKEAAKSFAHVTVFDSYHLACGLGLLVEEAAKMAIDEYSKDEIVDRLYLIRDKICSSFVVKDPTQLYRNGLMPNILYKIAKLLKFRIVLYMKDGAAVPAHIYTGEMENVYIKYVKKIVKNRNIAEGTFYLEYSECPVNVRNSIRNCLENELGVKNIVEMQSSASITANCGLDCIGLFFMQE